MPLIVYASFNKTYNNAHNLYALMFIMQSAMIGSFVAMDGFLFYIFWEVSLIPIFFIILMWGGENRQKTTFKFFIYRLDLENHFRMQFGVTENAFDTLDNIPSCGLHIVL